MTEIKYLLDEHVDPKLQAALQRRCSEIIVMRVGSFGAPRLGSDDPSILEWCYREGAILVTNNRSSMPVHLRERVERGLQSNGIFILKDKLSLGETAEELELIWGATELEEHLNLIRYLPISF